MSRPKRGFGQISKLPSGRYRARYSGPERPTPVRHSAPYTFDTRQDAEAWLVDERRLLATDTWTPPKSRPRNGVRRPDALTFELYARAWLRDRQLKPRTRAHYLRLLEQQLLPTFGTFELAEIGPDKVRMWHALQGDARPTLRAHAYGLLRTIFGSAASDQLVPVNPCTIRGAGNARRVHKIKPASLDELATLVAHMPERYRAMVLLATWCALRFGELTALRREDINTRDGIIHVRRGVVRTGGQVIVGTPKTTAGLRDVAIPPHLLPLLREHLLQHTEPGKHGLLFPAAGGGHLAPSTLYKVYYPARLAAGRPDLHFHDLRHTGAVLAAQQGATLAELMGRLGHSTPAAAMRYQHASHDRDQQLARKLSALVEDAQ